MKVEKKVWEEKMNNLIERRKREIIKNPVPGIDDYKAHINKAYIGKKVLDVGCGSQIIRKCLPAGTVYVGIDPFPMVPETIKMQIENALFDNDSFETIYAFAMLDNVHDVERALFQMKRIASKNILFLTGVEIEPDKYHTVKLSESLLIEKMKPFRVGHKEYLHPKILLIEFVK